MDRSERETSRDTWVDDDGAAWSVDVDSETGIAYTYCSHPPGRLVAPLMDAELPEAP
jgi:hypothetical protein